MRFHWQNLNEKPGDRLGSPLRHGRAWLNWGERRDGFHWEWVFHIQGIGAEIELAGYGDSAAIGFNFCLGFFSFYFIYDNFRLKRWIEEKTKRSDEKYGDGREIGIKWFEGDIVVNLWQDPIRWSSRDPWCWHIRINPKDLILGRQKCTHRDLNKQRVEIPMPEAVYAATVVIQEWEWRRPRWPFPIRIIRSEITPDTPIPFPGKGENSWDCGEDASHSMTCNADTPLKAVVKMVESVLSDRYRNGGLTWRPEKEKV